MGQGRGQSPASQGRSPRIAVMLAGWLNPPPLRETVGAPLLALPYGPSGTLLDAWIDAFATERSVEQIRIVVNSEEDAARLRSMPAARSGTANRPTLDILPEPQSWRGPAGLLRDVTGELNDDDLILISETSCLPPRAMRPLVEPMRDLSLVGTVGVNHQLEPAGVYLMTVRAIRVAPMIGYFDLKEQLLPALYDRSWTVRPARLEQPVARARDRSGYLKAIRCSLIDANNEVVPRISSQASVSGSAILDGACIVDDGAVIEDGAVVHDSVVMRGATVGGGAVVSQSVVGPLARVQPREKLICEVRGAWRRRESRREAVMAENQVAES